MRLQQLAMIGLLTPLLIACSNAPSDNDVQALIEAQYEQANTMMADAVADMSDDKDVQSISEMTRSMMPKLESVEDINCAEADGKNTYVCTANITQTIAGNSRTNKTSFKIYQVNDEWVLGN